MTRSAGATCRALLALCLLAAAAPADAATYEEWAAMMREKGFTDVTREGYAAWQADQDRTDTPGQGPKQGKTSIPADARPPTEAERRKQALAAAGVAAPQAGAGDGQPPPAPAPPPSASGALDRRDAQGRTGDQRMQRAARRFSEVFREDARRAEAVDELGGAGSGAAPSPGGGSGRPSRGFDFSSAGRPSAPAASGGPAAAGAGGAGPGSLRAVQASAVGGPFRDMGLRAARGADGQETVLRADGTPASPAEVRELRRRLEREPLALMQRPDFFNVLPRPQFEGLREDYDARPGMRATVFKDVAATAPGARDFQWSRSCSRLDGDCNANASSGRYEAGRYVAPEDLRKMALAARAEKAGEEGAAKSGDAKAGEAKAGDAKSPERARRTKEFWDQLAKEDEEFQKKLEAEEAAASGARKRRSGMGRLLDELAASLSGGGASDEGGRPEEETLSAEAAGAVSAAGAAVPGRLGSDALRSRRPPGVAPRGQGAQRRRVWTAGVVAALALMLGLWARRRV